MCCAFGYRAMISSHELIGGPPEKLRIVELRQAMRAYAGRIDHAPGSFSRAAIQNRKYLPQLHTCIKQHLDFGLQCKTTQDIFPVLNIMKQGYKRRVKKQETLTIRITTEVRKRLDELATRRDESRASIVRRFIMEGLARNNANQPHAK